MIGEVSRGNALKDLVPSLALFEVARFAFALKGP
jgi:hypothetical protein